MVLHYFVILLSGNLSPALILSSCNYNIGVFFYPIMTEIAGTEGTIKLASFDIFNGLSLCILVPFMFYVLKRRNYTSQQKEDKKKSDLELEKITNQKEDEDIEKGAITEPDQRPATKENESHVTERNMDELQSAKSVVEQIPNEDVNGAEAKKSNNPSTEAENSKPSNNGDANKRTHQHHRHHRHHSKKINEEQKVANSSEGQPISNNAPEGQIKEKKQKVDLAMLPMFGKKVLLF
jgi:hypothetical protein